MVRTYIVQFTDDVFSRDAVHTTDFIGCIQDLSHQLEAKVNKANRQSISVVHYGSFMRRDVFLFFLFVRTDSKNTLLGTCPKI